MPRSPQYTKPIFSSAPIELPIAPDSGQRFRLRGGEGPWEGYLEVRGSGDKPWGHVCDADGSWTIQEANVVCRHLGFNRGAQKSIQGMEFGPLTLDQALVQKVECSGSEANVTGCKVYFGSDCMLHAQVVGVRCHRDTQSLCAKDEHLYANACYKLMSQEPLNRDRARQMCENDGGQLIHIYSQVHSNQIRSDPIAMKHFNISLIFYPREVRTRFRIGIAVKYCAGGH